MLKQRRFAIICIILSTTNQKCNTLGATLGFFFHSKNVPEKVIQALHHLGVCDSQKSIHNAIDSMSREAVSLLKRRGQTFLQGVAYDNFDVNASTDQPTLENRSKFHHATSALMIKL
ncbi:hypothetical protein M422DRAFT_190874, partial [Sphaerobolus stellatus SS14]